MYFIIWLCIAAVHVHVYKICETETSQLVSHHILRYTVLVHVWCPTISRQHKTTQWYGVAAIANECVWCVRVRVCIMYRLQTQFCYFESSESTSNSDGVVKPAVTSGTHTHVRRRMVKSIELLLSRFSWLSSIAAACLRCKEGSLLLESNNVEYSIIYFECWNARVRECSHKASATDAQQRIDDL